VGGTSTLSYVNNWEPGPGCSFSYEIFYRLPPYAKGVAKQVHSYQNDEPYGLFLNSPDLIYNNSLRRSDLDVRTQCPNVNFDIWEFDKTVRQMLEETGKCQLLLNTSYTKAYTKNNTIKSIEAISSLGESYEINAKVFIDCTGGAFVCRSIGCEMMFGEEAQSVFEEPSAPETPSNFLNAISLCYKVKPKSGANNQDVGAPEDFKYHVVAQVTGPVGKEKKLTVNPLGIIEGNLLITQNKDSLYIQGKKIVDRHWAKFRTYPHFRDYEFDSYAPKLGVRESYRVVTEYILTQHDLLQGISRQKHDDIITLADHPMDIHGKDSGLSIIKDAYGVPYRCLIPKGWDNVLVACRGAGFSHIAASSCRLSRTIMSLGHAAGFAASIAAKNNILVKDVPIKRIQAEMNLKLRPKEELFADPQPINKIIGEMSYDFFITDNGKDSIFRVSKTGEIVWSYPAPNCQDIWSMQSGNVLFTYHHGENGIGGVVEVTKDKEVVFHYQTEGEVHTCQRLENGDTMIGINKDASIIEVDKNGNIKKTILLKTERRGHDAIRMARQLKNGNYLVSQEGDNLVAEYNRKGKLLKTFSSPGKCFDAIRLDSRNTIICDGSVCSVRELDSNGKVVWQVSKKDFPEIKMNWLAGIEVLPNGNILVCNWLGHGQSGNGIPVFEISKDKNILMYYTDNVRTKSISNISVIQGK
uniref:FAD-dependent oxidoreductase n=1 Tax=Mariniphaga sediminis TaxID=1628158 RepID=UPI0035691F84